MVLKIHGLPGSTCTQAVVVALKEAGIPYELVVVNIMAGEQKKPKYLETMHPFGLVPVLEEEDGFKLYESRAIARYAISKYAPDSGLIPKDPKKNAIFEQAASVETSAFYPYAFGLAMEKVFKPYMGLTGSEELAADHAHALEEKLKVYEVILGKQKYLAGNELTLVDLLHLPYGDIITNQAGFNGLTVTPNVARWWSDISSRESWKGVIADLQAFRAKK